MRLLLFLALFSLCEITSAQIWVENNAEWHYEFGDYVNNYTGIDRTFHAFDSLIDGHLAKAFVRERNAYRSTNDGEVYYVGQWIIDTNYTYVGNDTIYWSRGSTFEPLLFPAIIDEKYTIESEVGECSDSAFIQVTQVGEEYLGFDASRIEFFTNSTLGMRGAYSNRIGQCWFNYSSPSNLSPVFIMLGSVFPTKVHCGNAFLNERYRFLCFSDDSLSVSIPQANCSNYYPGFNWTQGYNPPPIIYPNPTNGEVFIENSRIIRVEVCTLTGEKVAQFEDVSIEKIDLSNLSSGTYLLKLIRPNNYVFVEKIDLIH